MTDKDKVKNAILKYHLDYDKKFPSKVWICRYANIPTHQIDGIISELIKEGFIRKYQTNHYVPKEQASRATIKKPIAPIIKKIMGETIKNSFNLFKNFNIVTFICFMCFIISSVAIYVTSALSFEWTKIMFEDVTKALILSITLPLFATFSIEGAIVLFRERNKVSITFGILILIMSLFAIGFDGSMIIIAQYNKRQTQVTKSNEIIKDTKKENTAYDLALSQKTRQEKIVFEIEEELKEAKNKLKLFEVNTKEYNNQNWIVNNTNYKLGIERNNLTKKENELKERLSKESVTINIIEKDDAYTWLAKNLFHIPVDKVEFAIFAMLAVFLVIVAPMGMFIAMGLWRNKK